MIPIFLSLIPIVLIAFSGWTIRRFKGITEEGERGLMRLVVYLLMPCFILSNTLGNPLLLDARLVLEAGTVGYTMTAIGIAVAYFLAPLFRIQRGIVQRSFAVGTGCFNYGYVAIPVARLFLDDATIGVLLVANVGVELAIWSIGVALLAGKFNRRSLRNLLNPPVLAIVVALILNFTGTSSLVPGVLTQTFMMLGVCAIPIGLVMTGASFVGLASGSLPTLRQPAIAIGAILTRLAILPLLFISLASLLPLPEAIRMVIVIHAAMPSAVILVILSKHYGGDTATIAQCAILTILGSLITIPLWIRLGFSWLVP